MSAKQNLTFLKHFIQSPKSVGSVIPSSTALVQTMVRDLDWPNVKSVVELGAGTGVVTSEIENLRREDSIFLSFECAPQMHANLKNQFPRIKLKKNAFNLIAEVEDIFPENKVDCVVSGLPFTSFSEAERQQMLADIHTVLKPGGYLVLYQFSSFFEKYIRTHFDDVTVQTIWANIPPAKVFFCKK